jgi:uncharacterized protein (DUF486 family)
MQTSTLLTTAGLLAASNMFMAFAWYAHLKNLSDKPWWITLGVFVPFAIL